MTPESGSGPGVGRRAGGAGGTPMESCTGDVCPCSPDLMMRGWPWAVDSRVMQAFRPLISIIRFLKAVPCLSIGAG
jgi:hypothetical protein